MHFGEFMTIYNVISLFLYGKCTHADVLKHRPVGLLELPEGDDFVVDWIGELGTDVEFFKDGQVHSAQPLEGLDILLDEELFKGGKFDISDFYDKGVALSN